MRARAGERVGAVFATAKDGVVEMLGYGVYEGDFVPVEGGGWMAAALKEAQVPNPRIRLDNGDVVYGCECWWGPEESVKERVAGHPIRTVSIGDKRTAVVLPEPEAPDADAQQS